MHKSKGNAVEPFTVIKNYGADATRWYMLYASPVWTPLKFDEDGIKEINSKFFNTLKNTYTFFEMYANTDKVDPRTYKIEYKDLEEIDQWLISKYNKLVKYVTESFDEYDLNKVVKAISNFVSEDLSNWYIRRNRRRFWKSESDTSKKAVYQTTYEILVGLCELIAPIAPFTSEEIYTKLTGNKSVHLANYPKCNEKLINEKIEERMDLVRDLISLGRNAREEAKIKVRQPISEVLIDGKNETLISDLLPLIEEELNVKNVVFVDNVNAYMDFMVKPNFKIAGPVFGPKIKFFGEALSNLPVAEINKLQNSNNITVMVDGEEFEISPDMADIRISAKEGFDVAMENNNFIILNTELTNELIEEGIAREFISKIQNMRKTKDYNIVDRITIYYSGDTEVVNTVNSLKEFIMKETLATDIVEKSGLEESFDLNGHDTFLDTKRND